MNEPWNINIHYDAKLDASVPHDAQSVLDVGCGDGFLAGRLSRRVPRVVAIDIDNPVLGRAKQRFPDVQVEWRQGDILAEDSNLGRFDAVVSNAALHHLPDTRAALRRLRALVNPGGTLGIVTFARTDCREFPWAVITLAARLVVTRLHRQWAHTAPIVWPPRDTVNQLHRHVHAELPGAKLERLLLGRIFIFWRAPTKQIP
jgi:2-polyprenyl-3-methyl-5-hydroxy-6-metoxy-1,4-benzoquinol methylase